MSTNHSTAAEAIKKILALLPGVDCNGGCGKATCQACAEAIADGESTALCPACGQDAVNAIAEVVGKEPQTVKDEIAFVACSGDAAGKKRFAGGTCREAAEAGFARGECQYGCIGCGDCVSVCKFDAMKVSDGDVIIDTAKCNGCRGLRRQRRLRAGSDPHDPERRDQLYPLLQRRRGRRQSQRDLRIRLHRLRRLRQSLSRGCC